MARAELIIQRQPEFWEVTPTAGEEVLRASPPVHTGERVEKDWERCVMILEEYAQDQPIRSICRRHQVSPNTLFRLVDRHKSVVETFRVRARSKLARIATLLMDRLETDAYSMPIATVPVTLGIVVDKLQQIDTGVEPEENRQKEPAVDPRKFLEQFLPEPMRIATPDSMSDDESSVVALVQCVESTSLIRYEVGCRQNSSGETEAARNDDQAGKGKGGGDAAGAALETIDG